MEVLEMRREILEDVRDKIKPVGQGKTLFPYDSVAIRICAQNGEERDLRQAALSESGDLERDIAALLAEADRRMYRTKQQQKMLRQPMFGAALEQCAVTVTIQ